MGKPTLTPSCSLLKQTSCLMEKTSTISIYKKYTYFLSKGSLSTIQNLHLPLFKGEFPIYIGDAPKLRWFQNDEKHGTITPGWVFTKRRVGWNCNSLKHMNLGGDVQLMVKFPKIVVPPKSSIFVGFSIINHPFCGIPIVGNTPYLEPKWPFFCLDFRPCCVWGWPSKIEVSLGL